MSKFTHRTLIVPASLVSTCQALAEQFPSGAGMWVTPLSMTGTAPATHYISAGNIWQEFADILVSPEALAEATKLPIQQAQAILGVCTVSDGDPRQVLAQAGLSIVQDVQE